MTLKTVARSGLKFTKNVNGADTLSRIRKRLTLTIENIENMKTRTAALIAAIIGTAALVAQGEVATSNVAYWDARICPNAVSVIVTQRTIGPGTWVVNGVANIVYTNANPGHNQGVAFIADVTTLQTTRLDGYSSLPGTVFTSKYGYQTGSPQRVITVTRPTVVNLVVFVVVGAGDAKAWGSIVASKQ
jgi:hypothetical protein